MAIVLEANYSKKLGLPQYSSHQYSVTVRTEVSNLSKIEEASSHLYRQLQDAVDRDIQETGFLPGSESPGQQQPAQFGRKPNSRMNAQPDQWNCSEKQRSLIEKLMDEHKIPFDEVDVLARQRFNSGLRELDRLRASSIIDELFSRYGSKSKAGSYQRGGRR